MSLDLITRSSGADHPSEAAGHRSYAWLLPATLVTGFLLTFLLLFGQRLMPAHEVRTSQVITLRLSQEHLTAPKQADTPPALTPGTPPSNKGSMLFQASGWVEPDPYVTYVPVLVNGVVDQVHVLEGQTVRAGDLLATLIDDDAQLALKEAKQRVSSQTQKIKAHCMGLDIAEAEMQAAEKKIEASIALKADAEDNLIRLEKLPAEAIPEQQVVQARLAKVRHEALVAEAEAAIPQIRARIQQIHSERLTMTSVLSELELAVDTAELALSRTRITSPMDGIVLKLHAAPGKKRMLNSDNQDSAVLVELYDPEHLQARVDVALAEASALKVGQIVELSSEILVDTPFFGRVTRIGGEADIQRNTLQAKIAIDRPDHRLRPEMLVRAKFYQGLAVDPARTTSEGAAMSPSPRPGGGTSPRLALFVDQAALVSESQVWVVSAEETAELRSITLADQLRGGHRQVLQGLLSGERVILPPHDELKNGTRLKVLNQKP